MDAHTAGDAQDPFQRALLLRPDALPQEPLAGRRWADAVPVAAATAAHVGLAAIVFYATMTLATPSSPPSALNVTLIEPPAPQTRPEPQAEPQPEPDEPAPRFDIAVDVASGAVTFSGDSFDVLTAPESAETIGALPEAVRLALTNGVRCLSDARFADENIDGCPPAPDRLAQAEAAGLSAESYLDASLAPTGMVAEIEIGSAKIGFMIDPRSPRPYRISIRDRRANSAAEDMRNGAPPSYLDPVFGD